MLNTVATIHIKDSALRDQTLCGVTEDALWTTRLSARAVSTCAECVQIVLQDECSVCNSRGVISNGCKCCGKFQCRHCDIEAADAIIVDRAALRQPISVTQEEEGK